MAAGIGAGLPVHEPAGNMVVDIGGGTTEVAVISMGGIVTSQSVRTARRTGRAIIQFIKKETAWPETTAEEVKIASGRPALQDEVSAEVRGRDLITGWPRRSPPRPRRSASDRGASGGHRGRRQGDVGQHASRAGRRHHRPGHSAHWWWRTAPRLAARLAAETGMPIVVAESPLQWFADRPPRPPACAPYGGTQPPLARLRPGLGGSRRPGDRADRARCGSRDGGPGGTSTAVRR